MLKKIVFFVSITLYVFSISMNTLKVKTTVCGLCLESLADQPCVTLACFKTHTFHTKCFKYFCISQLEQRNTLKCPYDQKAISFDQLKKTCGRKTILANQRNQLLEFFANAENYVLIDVLNDALLNNQEALQSIRLLINHPILSNYKKQFCWLAEKLGNEEAENQLENLLHCFTEVSDTFPELISLISNAINLLITFIEEQPAETSASLCSKLKLLLEHSSAHQQNSLLHYKAILANHVPQLGALTFLDCLRCFALGVKKRDKILIKQSIKSSINPMANPLTKNFIGKPYISRAAAAAPFLAGCLIALIALNFPDQCSNYHYTFFIAVSFKILFDITVNTYLAGAWINNYSHIL
ncbi:hypothetical protein H0X48_05020 [Candidatus Dependentiae bacterium]|nr:hypothetical protein [Candidatus Dependentiae bacterium]